jgi:hypothetical protein
VLPGGPAEAALPIGPEPASQWPPLSPDKLAVFRAGPEDPPPANLDAVKAEMEGNHFLASDELRLDLFYASLRDLGGGFVGVGTDQCYLFAGWMNAELVWLSDYDPWVKALHQVYLLLFREAPNADDFLARWTKSRADEVRALIDQHFSADPDLALIHKVFAKARVQVYQRLRYTQKMCRRANVPCFVTDPAQYTRVRDLALAGRMRPIVGNLLGTVGLRAVGDAARSLGVPVRVLYVSNAESYWSYGDAYRQNVASLPYDERSLVVRTKPTKPKNADYAYSVQSAQLFARWLALPSVKNIRQVWPYQAVRGPDHFPWAVLTAEPPALPKEAEEGAASPGQVLQEGQP